MNRDTSSEVGLIKTLFSVIQTSGKSSGNPPPTPFQPYHKIEADHHFQTFQSTVKRAIARDDGLCEIDSSRLGTVS